MSQPVSYTLEFGLASFSLWRLWWLVSPNAATTSSVNTGRTLELPICSRVPAVVITDAAMSFYQINDILSVTSDIHKTDRIGVLIWNRGQDFRVWIMSYTCSTLIWFLYFATEEGPFWGWNVLLYWTRLPPDSRFKILSPTPCYEYLSLLHLIGQQQPRSWRTKAWLLWRTCRSHLRSWTTINGLESGMDTDSVCVMCKDVTYAL